MYESLTNYLEEFQGRDFGTIVSGKHDVASWQIPHVCYSETVSRFIDEVYRFVDEHNELQNYSKILKDNGIDWDSRLMTAADVDKLDAECVLALILGAIRAERFCDGALLRFLKDGAIVRWLERLKAIDMGLK